MNERLERAPCLGDPLALRLLLIRMQREVEGNPIVHGDKLRALQALSVLAGCIEQGVVSSEQALTQAQTLFVLADALPAARELSRHFPTLQEPVQPRVADAGVAAVPFS
nr:hypothetical protein [Variovorax boronicumulans]